MSIQPIEDHEAVAPSPLLFEPITFRRVTLRSRIVVSPMAMYSAHDGFADDFHLVHLGRFALGGAGLIFIEATAITAQGRITSGCNGLGSTRRCRTSNASRISSIASAAPQVCNWRTAAGKDRRGGHGTAVRGLMRRT
jgi:2,4-dienoyl-CoA reductase-like NADH-dependent reductase (Old Yellow Enzyme family)